MKKLLKSLVPQPVRAFTRHTIATLRNLSPVPRIRAKLDPLLSRYLYGNTVEYWANVKGKKDWAAARKAFGEGFDEGLHQQFMNTGYADLSMAADAECVRRLQKSFNKAIVDPDLSYNPFADPESLKYYNHGNYQGADLGEYRRHVKNCNRVFPEHLTLLNDRLVYLIQSCLGSNFDIESVHAYRNNYCPPHILQHFEPHASRWHFDDQVSDGMRLFVYLTDVTDKHGPFQCFDRGYSRYLLRKGFSKAARKESVTGGLSEKLFDTPRLKSHTGPAGTLVLCATSFCLHRAGDMTGAGNYRDVLLYNLRPSVTKLNRTPCRAAA